MGYPMPTLRVVTFNAHDNYGQIVARGDERVPRGHILIVPEAYQEGDVYSQRALEAMWSSRENLIADVLYNDMDGRKDRHHLVLVGDAEVVEHIQPIQLLGRTALRASLKGNIDVIGVHLDDRDEDTRCKQTQALLDQVDPDRLTIIAGDFNAIHRDDRRAQLLRALGPFAGMFPEGEPGTKQSKIARLGSLATRLTMMAEGGPLAMMEGAGYHDADSSRRATMGFVQLDHIMVPRDLSIATVFVQPLRGLSDHAAIGADILIP